MKKMIFSFIASMMLLGSVNSNAQNKVLNDRPRQKMSQKMVIKSDHRTAPQKAVVAVDRVPDRTPDRVYVVKDNPRPRRVDTASNTVVAAAVRAAVGALLTAVTR